MGSIDMPDSAIYLYGVRSPLVVDYEETLVRLRKRCIPVCVDEKHSRCVIFEESVSQDNLEPERPFICCAFMPARRKVLSEMAEKSHLSAAVALIDPSAIVATTSTLGEGSFCNAGVTIGGMTHIGQHALINRNSNIGHHVIIDDFVSLGPSVTVSGGVIIGSGVMIGAGSVLLPGVTVGDNSIVAAGAVVNKNVAQNTMVAGIPAVVKKRGNVFSGVQINGEE